MLKKFFVVLIIGIVIFVVARQFGSQTTTESPSINIATNKENPPQNKKPILGIHYRMIDGQTARQNNIVEGAYITQIIKGSPAEKANLQEEDIVTEIDGRGISKLDQQSVYDLISTLKPGSKVSLTIWRNQEIKTALVTLD